MDNWLVYVLVFWFVSIVLGVAIGTAIDRMGGGAD